MSITVNEGGTLYTLDTITANEDGTLYKLDTVYSNEGGVLYEIHNKNSIPMQLIWSESSTSADTTTLTNQTNNGFRVTVSGCHEPGSYTRVSTQQFHLEEGYNIYITCLSATTTSGYHPKMSITLWGNYGTADAAALDPSDGRYKLYSYNASNNDLKLYASGFCIDDNNDGATVDGAIANVMFDVEIAKS